MNKKQLEISRKKMRKRDTREGRETVDNRDGGREKEITEKQGRS